MELEANEHTLTDDLQDSIQKLYDIAKLIGQFFAAVCIQLRRATSLRASSWCVLHLCLVPLASWPLQPPELT